MGEVGAGGGTRGPRRRARRSHPNWKEPVLPEEPRALRGTIPGVPHPTAPNPQGTGGNGHRGGLRKGTLPGDPERPTWSARRKGSDGAEHARAPHLQYSKLPGPGPAGAEPRTGARWGGYTGRAPRTPAASAGAAQSPTATPLPSMTRRLPQDGRAPGADPVHVGRRARSRPAPSSASLAAHGRRRRAPEAGGDRLQPV